MLRKKRFAAATRNSGKRCAFKKNYPPKQERLMVAQEFIDLSFPKYKVLTWCSVARSSFYYRPSTGLRGRKPYAVVKDKDGKTVDNETVVKIIERLFEHPFVDYGYYKTYIYLRKKQYFQISKHLVYRLMKDRQLLRNQYCVSSKKTKRNWVKDLLPQVEVPFTYFEFDIKFIWVAGRNRNLQVLTILDVFSRWNVSHLIAYSIKYQDVIMLFERTFQHLTIPEKFYVRCDNGSQFIADMVQKYFKDKKVIQEFTNPATPQQNSHIDRVAGAILSFYHGKRCLSEISVQRFKRCKANNESI